MGSDVYGLPSQETYLDSQNRCYDAAKIGIFLLSSKHFPKKSTFPCKFFFEGGNNSKIICNFANGSGEKSRYHNEAFAIISR